MDRDTMTAQCCRSCSRSHRGLCGRFCNELNHYVEYPSQRADACPMGKFPARERPRSVKQATFEWEEDYGEAD